jgi:signal transduction histidine kinase
MMPQRALSTGLKDFAPGSETKATRRSHDLLRLRRFSDDLKAQVADLEAQVVQLTEANRALTCFAADAAHELIEPLVILESSALMLSEELVPSLDPILRSRLDTLGTVAARGRLLVESLLQEARSAHRPVRLTSVDIRAVVDHALTLVTANANGLAPRITVGPMPTITTSPELMSVVMRNLVVNAVKHAIPADSQIAITADRGAAGWRLSVVSQGPPITAEEEQRILRRFERGAESRGAGLGLAICARIVERLGGTLGVVPDPVGGNLFFVNLPDASHGQ